ncbi:MAG: hypothetical protein ACJ77N_12460, partial [Chloroflexota bacterium]
SSSATAARPGASGDTTNLYARIEAQVRQIRGLDATAPVDPKVIDADQLTAKIRTSFARDNPKEYVAADGRLLEHLGLLPAGTDLGELYIRLLSSQVIGLYDDEDKTLYVVSDKTTLGPLEQTTFAHEYTHALQDQNFGIAKFVPKALDEGDVVMARTAVVEGDASELMFSWAQQALTPAQYQQMLTDSSDQSQADDLAKMPAILREDLLFPYVQGLSFLIALQGGRDGSFDAVDRVFRDPPLSTEQIVHPDRYTAHDAPVKVDLPKSLTTRLGSGWTMPLVDTFGEFQTNVWLRDAGKLDTAAATTASSGWGGDRLGLFEGPGNAWAVVFDTTWDTANDANEFRTAATTTIDKIAPGGAGAVLQRDAKGATVIVASSSEVAAKVAGVLGLAG